MINANINKKLKISDRIVFILNDTLIDGTIIEKNHIGNGDIDFIIGIGEGKSYRTKHRKLDLYYKLK